MPSTDKALVCRRCEVIPETISVEGDRVRLVCPRCGNAADRDVAIKAAGLHFSRDELKSFQDRQVRSTRGSQACRVSPRSDPPNRARGFHFPVIRAPATGEQTKGAHAMSKEPKPQVPQILTPATTVSLSRMPDNKGYALTVTLELQFPDREPILESAGVLPDGLRAWPVS